MRSPARNVQIPFQAFLASQELHTRQEPLETLEVDVAFCCNQFLLPFLPCMMPALRDPGRAVGCVDSANLAKPCLLDESFVLSRGTVHVIADRAARGDFFMREHSADDQSITEQHPPARFQYAKHLPQHLGPSGKMAQNVIREHGIKGLVFETKILRNIALLEMRE